MGQNQIATCKNPIILWKLIRNAETGCFYAIYFYLEERAVVMEPSSPMQVGEHVFRGVLLRIAFCLLAPLLDVFAKLAAQKIPVAQITAARFLLQSLFMCSVLSYLVRSLSLHMALLPMLFCVRFF